MSFFNRITPGYKTASSLATKATQPAATSGGLSGLLGSLFGNKTPNYKMADGRGVNAPASSGIFGRLLCTVVPSYKAAPEQVATVETLDEMPIDALAQDGDDASMPCLPTSDEVVLL